MYQKIKKCAAAIAFIIFAATMSSQIAHAKAPFGPLLGTWFGKGTVKLKDGKQDPIECKGYYTGDAKDLGMNILCTSKDDKIEMRCKLSFADGKITGKWEERNFNAEGDLTGTAKNKSLSLTISGAVKGSMDLTFSSKNQTITIKTPGADDLDSVTIKLAKK